MENNSADLVKLSSDIRQKFNIYSVILFVGSNVNINELPESIKNMPFSCILTTCKYDTISDVFSNGYRKITVYTSVEELREEHCDIFNGKALPIVYLNGIETDDVLSAPEDNAKELLDFITFRSNINTLWIITDYCENNVGEFPSRKLFRCLSKANGEIKFFYEETIDERIRETLSNASFYEGSFFALYEDDFFPEDDNIDLSGDCDIFFIDGKEFIAPEVSFQGFKPYGELLNFSIDRYRPYGKENRKAWFTRFMCESYRIPQWYGYSENVSFYVKRCFEDTLYFLAKNLLTSGNLLVKGKNIPIILQGDPCTSKSIELAAVAYRIYQEKQHPVIYISRDDLILNQGSEEFECLDSLMLDIERLGNTYKKVLIVWDCSAYHDVERNAAVLINDLQNRGRNFVLICSAYRNAVQMDCKARYSLEPGNNGYFKKIKCDAIADNCVEYDGKHYIITADRLLNDSEKVQIENFNKEFWESNEFSNFDETQRARTDIFYYYFTTYRLLQPSLCGSLNKEQKAVLDVVVRRADKLINYKRKEESLFALAFKELGIDVSAYDVSEEDGNYNISEDARKVVEKFCDSVAVFSQFKLPMPADYGFYIFNVQDFWNQHQNIMSLITGFTYIVYDNPYDKGYVFTFRLPLEAEIYIEKNEITPLHQIEILCDLLEWCGKKYENLSFETIYNIQSLLRFMGPNTGYVPFCKNGKRFKEHLAILSNFDKVIEKLRMLREVNKISDMDASFSYGEVTYVREYYGVHYGLWEDCEYSVTTEKWEKYKNWFNESSYKKRISKLREAIKLARSSINLLNDRLYVAKDRYYRRHLQQNINGLCVELCICDNQLASVIDEYKQFCKHFSIDIDEVYVLKSMSYQEQYDNLTKVINSAPFDGYAYNQLFDIFEKNYQNNMFRNDIVKARYLSQIISLCDECSSYDMINIGAGGRDEIGNHIMKIRGFLSEYDADIASIQNKKANKDFLDLFDAFIEQKRAAGICFVCQYELQRVGLDNYSIRVYLRDHEGLSYCLTSQQKKVCKKIIEFMENYTECIQESREAIYLLIRIYWMYYNGYCMDNREDKRTYIKDQAVWKKIYDMCDMYRTLLYSKPRCGARSDIMPVNVLLLQELASFHLEKFDKVEQIIGEFNEKWFSQSARMHTPYIICDGEGEPIQYDGIITDIEDAKHGKIEVNLGGNNKKLDFYVNNVFTPPTKPQRRQRLKKLVLGIGYMRVSVRGMGDRVGGSNIVRESIGFQ